MLWLKRARKRFRWSTLGFTLVEVTAVTAIMSAAASSGGSYAMVRNRTSEIQCLSNCRAIAQAIQLCSMTQGRLPKAAFYPKDPNGKDSIMTLLKRHGAPPKLFKCPSAPSTIQTKGLTFVWNDKYSGKPLGGGDWLMVEVNAVDPKAPAPHSGKYHVIYADGNVKATTERPSFEAPK